MKQQFAAQARLLGNERLTDAQIYHINEHLMFFAITGEEFKLSLVRGPVPAGFLGLKFKVTVPVGFELVTEYEGLTNDRTEDIANCIFKNQDFIISPARELSR